jgi:hypothetical protein
MVYPFPLPQRRDFGGATPQAAWRRYAAQGHVVGPTLTLCNSHPLATQQCFLKTDGSFIGIPLPECFSDPLLFAFFRDEIFG